MLKNKIFNYIILEFFKIFVFTLLIISLLSWFIQAARLLELITEYGNSVSIYAQFLVLRFPRIVENLIPISFLISIFFLFTKLEEENELNIYWYSGISQFKIVNIIIFTTLIVFIFYMIISIYIAPLSSGKARHILSNSKFTLINTLIKERNFNSPLKGITVYVNKNNQNGEIEGVFIYEESRTVVAEKGKVISDGENLYLELINGSTIEKSENNFNRIYFSSTIYDFSKFKNRNLDVPKESEKSTIFLIKNLKKELSKKEEKNLRSEINSRLIKPFCIFSIALLGLLMMHRNKNGNINFKYPKIIFYILGVFLLVLTEIGVGISSENFEKTFIYFISIISIIFLQYLYLYILFEKKIFYEKV